jgi:hypothetical protein
MSCQQKFKEFKPNHLSLCDPLSFVAQRGGNLLYAIQTIFHMVLILRHQVLL